MVICSCDIAIMGSYGNNLQFHRECVTYIFYLYIKFFIVTNPLGMSARGG